MNRFFEGIIVTAVILFALFVCGWMVYDGVSETNKNKDYIGREIVVYNDTLTIMGYNASLGYHILDNGLIVDKEYVRAKALLKRPNNAQIDGTFIKKQQITKIDTTRYGLNP